jgi:hypothetical protein
MMDDEKQLNERRAALMEEENHYNALRLVFKSSEGLDVLEWLLNDVCGYWRGTMDSERQIGKFEIGRLIFNQICIADMAIIHAILDRRRRQAEAVRIEERNRIERKSE